MSEMDRYKGPVEGYAYHLFAKDRGEVWTRELYRKLAERDAQNLALNRIVLRLKEELIAKITAEKLELEPVGHLGFKNENKCHNEAVAEVEAMIQQAMYPKQGARDGTSDEGSGQGTG